MRVKLDAAFMKSQLVCPPGKRRIEYIDQNGIPGLYIEVREASPGHGTFYVRWKGKDGRNSHQKIGDSRFISLTQARERAKELRAKICLGEDPKADDKARKSSITYAEFFEKHYLPYITPRKRSWKRDRNLYSPRIRDVFGGKKLGNITRQQLQEFHTALAKEGLAPASCNHFLKMLRYSLRLAVDWGMLESTPAARLPLFHEDNKIDNTLDEGQLSRLVEVLTTDSNVMVCRVALLLLSTGCRRQEILSLKWKDVDLENRVLTIRATNSKNRKSRTVPLNDSAMEIINALDTKGQSEYLFVNRKTGRPIGHFTRVWHRLRRKAGVPNLRLHDLRHQFATTLLANGRSILEASMLLGHSHAKITERYLHVPTITLREAANSASLPIVGVMKRAG